MTEVHPERDTVSIATTIADWCDARAQQLGDNASRQFRLIVGLVLIGLVLLLVLPPVIGLIDFSTSKLFGGSPPNEVVEDVERGIEQLGAQVQRSQGEVDKLTDELKAIRARLAGHAEKRIQLVERAASLFSAPLALWRTADVGVGPDPAGIKSLHYSALTMAPDGALLAAGSETSLGVSRIVILRSEDGRTWAPIRPEDDKGEPLRGRLEALAVALDGALLAAGSEAGPGGSGIVILRSEDGRTWAPIRPEDGKGKRLGGWLNALTVAPDGALLAAGSEVSRGGFEIVILRSEDGRTWAPIRPEHGKGQRLGGSLSALTVAPDGALLAAGWEEGHGESGIVILRSEDGRTWAPIRPEDGNGQRLVGSLGALTVAPDGSLFAAGAGIWNVSLAQADEGAWLRWPRDGSWDDRPERVAGALDGLLAMVSQEGLGYPQGTAALRSAAEETRRAWARDRESEVRVVPLVEDADNALAQQKDTLTKVRAGSSELAKALRGADELNRASRIATRIAVVALLIYLVQIVVNRYRYLQRMAGFYQARAHALRLVAASPQEADAMLKDVSVTDLMFALSPDAIGFDKSAEPPTQNMISMMREAFRRERTG